MKIPQSGQEGQSAPKPAGRKARAGSANPAAPAEAAAAAPQGDKAAVSGLSGRLASAIKTDQAARAHKVSALEAAVQSGAYKVDAEKLASALVEDALGPKDLD